MAKGPHSKKTGARAKPSAKSATGTRKAQAQSAPQSASQSASKPATKTASKTASRAAKSKAAHPADGLSKAALRRAFEHAMRGRGLDEAEDAFDAALKDLYGDEPAPEQEPEGAPDDGSQSVPHTGKLMGGGFQGGEMGNLLDFYSRMLNAQGGTGDDVLNDMTQGFSMVLGSGPAFAALESMLSNVSAQGAVLMNAVQTQRQLDQIGLCCTSECVKQLMNMNAGYDE